MSENSDGNIDLTNPMRSDQEGGSSSSSSAPLIEHHQHSSQQTATEAEAGTQIGTPQEKTQDDRRIVIANNEEENLKYGDNEVITSKYTFLNFPFKFLW